MKTAMAMLYPPSLGTLRQRGTVLLTPTNPTLKSESNEDRPIDNPAPAHYIVLQKVGP